MAYITDDWEEHTLQDLADVQVAEIRIMNTPSLESWLCPLFSVSLGSDFNLLVVSVF